MAVRTSYGTEISGCPMADINWFTMLVKIFRFPPGLPSCNRCKRQLGARWLSGRRTERKFPDVRWPTSTGSRCWSRSSDSHQACLLATDVKGNWEHDGCQDVVRNGNFRMSDGRHQLVHDVGQDLRGCHHTQ